MRLFSYRDRPVHLGPYPLERLRRTTATPDDSATLCLALAALLYSQARGPPQTHPRAG